MLTRRNSMAVSPARASVTSRRTGPKLLMLSATSVYCVGRRTTPSGTTPSRTSRHKAIKSLRAKATIMSLRVPRAFSVRARNHWARRCASETEKSPGQLDHASPNSSYPSSVPLFDPKAVPSSRPALRPCRRAQELSGLAVAPTYSAFARPYLDTWHPNDPAPS